MEEETKAYRILLQMFEVIERTTREPPRACFNQLVRYLADCVRLRPLPEDERHVGARLMPLTMLFLEAFYEDPQDLLAPLFAEKGCANKDMGQIMTPRYIAQYINEQAIGRALEERENEERIWLRVLDPCVGTGMFLVEAAVQYPAANLAFYGIELDLDLYRAALVNMRLTLWGRPYYILRANTLVVDVRPHSPNWNYANQWNPPDWKTQMPMEEGGTWAEWCEAEGFEVEEAPTPRRDPESRDPEDPLQPRLM